jgi:hypothetical protein
MLVTRLKTRLSATAKRLALSVFAVGVFAGCQPMAVLPGYQSDLGKRSVIGQLERGDRVVAKEIVTLPSGENFARVENPNSTNSQDREGWVQVNDRTEAGDELLIEGPRALLRTPFSEVETAMSPEERQLRAAERRKFRLERDRRRAQRAQQAPDLSGSRRPGPTPRATPSSGPPSPAQPGSGQPGPPRPRPEQPRPARPQTPFAADTEPLDLRSLNWSAACREFVQADGEFGFWGEILFGLFDRQKHPQLFRNDISDLNQACPRFPRLTDEEKKHVWLRIITGMGHYESSCRERLEARGPNGTVAGFLQMHLNNEFKYGCRRGINANNGRDNLECSLIILNNDIRRTNKLFAKGQRLGEPNYWHVVQPRHGFGPAGIKKALGQSRLCRN